MTNKSWGLVDGNPRLGMGFSWKHLKPRRRAYGYGTDHIMEDT